MEQDFLKAKEEWKAKMRRGDKAEAARIAGVRWETFYEWLNEPGCMGSETDSRNLKAIKEAVRKRDRNLEAALAA